VVENAGRADVRVPEPRTTVAGGLPFVHVMVVFLQIGNGNTQLNQWSNLARCRVSRVPPSLITLSGFSPPLIDEALRFIDARFGSTYAERMLRCDAQAHLQSEAASIGALVSYNQAISLDPERPAAMRHRLVCGFRAKQSTTALGAVA
jgi:hypothetical protein